MRRHRNKAKPTQDKGPVIPAGVPSKSWKVDELRAFAVIHEIDLGEATTKADILAALAPAETNPPSPVGEDGIPVLTNVAGDGDTTTETTISA